MRMKYSIYVSEKQRGSLNDFNLKEFDDLEVISLPETEIGTYFPILYFDEFHSKDLLAVFPNHWKLNTDNLKKVIQIMDLCSEGYDLIQFEYKLTIFKRYYERLPAVVQLRLIVKYLYRLLGSLIKPSKYIVQRKEQLLSIHNNVNRISRDRLFGGYFLPNSRGFACSSKMAFEAKSLKAAGLSTDRVLMAIARDSGFKVATVFPRIVSS